MSHVMCIFVSIQYVLHQNKGESVVPSWSIALDTVCVNFLLFSTFLLPWYKPNLNETCLTSYFWIFNLIFNLQPHAFWPLNAKRPSLVPQESF